MLRLLPLDISKIKAYQSQPQTSLLQTRCQQFVSELSCPTWMNHSEKTRDKRAGCQESERHHV